MGKSLLFAVIKQKMIAHAWNPERSAGRPAWMCVLVPLFSAALVTWLIMQPLSFAGKYAPFLCYFGAIFFSACYGGSRCAFIATILTVLCAIFFLLPQHNDNVASSFGWLILFFLIEALMVTALFAIIETVQKRYKASEEIFRGIVEKNAEGFLMADEEGKITYVCSSVKQILGYEEQEIMGKNLQDLVHPDEYKLFNIHFIKILNHKGQSMSFLQRLKTGDGNWKWIEGCVNNLLKDNSVKRIVFNYRNVTDRINQIKQQEDFVHMASHELKTPITALRGYLQLLMINHQKEQRIQDVNLLDRMSRQTDRLLNLIDEMLNVTRIRAGELHYHFGIFSLQECVQDAVDSFKATIKSHEITLNTNSTPQITGDKDRISQVINNLISNAIKYSPDKHQILVDVSSDEDWITVTVKDDGIGIPKDQQKKIFDRFYRSETLPKNTYQGLGLGLYIAMDIIKKHNGKMGVESEPGKGSAFWFSLPVSPISYPTI